MKQYRVRLTGLSPLLMHADNIAFTEKLARWRADPGNKEVVGARGDDRGPPWAWLGYIYHDGRELGVSADNLMTMFREGGAKVKTGKAGGKETYKRHTQAGLMIDAQQFRLLVAGKPVPVAPFNSLLGNLDFGAHIDMAEAHGFELLVKRAKVGMSKHVRVRPMFRDWVAEGSVTIMDEETSGLTAPVLDMILKQAGSLVGIGDWRPSSPKSPGTFGRFAPTIEPM